MPPPQLSQNHYYQHTSLEQCYFKEILLLLGIQEIEENSLPWKEKFRYVGTLVRYQMCDYVVRAARCQRSDVSLRWGGLFE